jgi:hypothetical protein
MISAAPQYPTEAVADRAVAELIAIAAEGDAAALFAEIQGRLVALAGVLVEAVGPHEARDAFLDIADALDEGVN